MLAIDLGLRTGLAYFDERGRLARYHSHHVASRAALKRQVAATLKSYSPLGQVAMEGDPALYAIWARLLDKWGVPSALIQARRWREALLLPRERDHGGKQAKASAQAAALEVIAWSGAPRPKGALRHDAAEAILIGLWACLEYGWLDPRRDELPSFLSR